MGSFPQTLTSILAVSIIYTFLSITCKEVVILADFCLKWSLFYHLSGWVVTVGNKFGSHLRSSKPKHHFPTKWLQWTPAEIPYWWHVTIHIWVVLLIGHFKFKNWCNSTLIFISFAIERILSGRWPFLKSCVTLLKTNVLSKVNQN